METKIHNTTLREVMPKSGEYPVALRDAKSILVQEQSDLIPIYMDGGYVNFLEAKVIDTERRGDEVLTRVGQKEARNTIDEFRGKVENLVYGMHAWGSSGYPDLMVLTQDSLSKEPAIISAQDLGFGFEIKPKDFNLGLTGRILENSCGERLDESLSIHMDIYDAFNFAQEISPERIVALSNKGKYTVVYEKDKLVGKTETVNFTRNKKHYVFSESQKGHWGCETELLPTEGLKVVFSDFFEQIRNYERCTFLFGHKYENIDEFLTLVNLLDNHLIWKICRRDRQDPNTPIVDAERRYGTYQGHPRYENINRLHFMPDKANLWFDGTMISFDKATGIKALLDLGDIVRDVWFEPSSRNFDAGWDIVLDRSRGITPESPVQVYNDADYQKYPVIKK